MSGIKKTLTAIKAHRLARELYISPKTNSFTNEPGAKYEFEGPSISVTLNIGKEHTAELIMSLDAYAAFLKGAEVTIRTHREFLGKD